MRKPCPETNLQIPDYWENPPYQKLVHGFRDFGPMCLTVEDAKRIVNNQAMCDTYRKDLLDLVGAVK